MKKNLILLGMMAVGKTTLGKIVAKRQNLTFEEMKTFKKTFIKRLGYGIIYCQYFGFLPKVLFHLCFSILSPLSNPTIREPISKLYRRIFY